MGREDEIVKEAEAVNAAEEWLMKARRVRRLIEQRVREAWTAPRRCEPPGWSRSPPRDQTGSSWATCRTLQASQEIERLA